MPVNTIRFKQTLCTGLVTFCCLLSFYGGGHAETVDGLFNARVVLPGATDVVEVVQTASFPLCPQFLIFLGGQGSLGISLRNDASDSKEMIFMLGLASSSAGNFPIYRLGASEGMISQIVEIGSNRYPYGFVWLYCGVALADKGPVYQYELRLSLAP
jgi:hypothetical protein